MSARKALFIGRIQQQGAYEESGEKLVCLKALGRQLSKISIVKEWFEIDNLNQTNPLMDMKSRKQ